VRTVGEFEAGRAAGATSVPAHTGLFGTPSMQVDPAFVDKLKAVVPVDGDSVVLFGCGSGRRSMTAAVRAAEEGGYDASRLRNVGGGFGAWKEAGLPTEQG